MPLVEIRDLVRRYGKGAAAVAALRGVDICIEPGEFVAILGRSGSGKSTLLNLLAGLDHADEGRVRIAGEDLAQLSSDELARYRSRRIGIVFQSFHLLPGRSAQANVELPLTLDGVPRRERVERARVVLESVGLGERRTHTPAELSGGEQQRVAIARALVRDPALLLCDEPTGNLDSKTADEVMALLVELHRGGRTLVMVTHEQELARRSASRMVTMADGRIVADDAVAAGAGAA